MPLKKDEKGGGANFLKYLVTYFSVSGNTKKVAESIFSAIAGDKTIKSIEEIASLNEFDLVFIGTPVMQFGMPPAVRKFIADHADGKRIALFVTHAMLSTSSDPVQNTMLEKELEKCRSACSKSELIALFHCQGELSEKIAGELAASNIPMLVEFAGMRPATIGHPDDKEIAGAEDFARQIQRDTQQSITGL
jgi:flavodoxin